MLVNRSIAVFLAIALFAARGSSQISSAKPPVGTGPGLLTKGADSLSSSVAADRLREIARDLIQSKTLTTSQADQAIILLTAAKNLDRVAADIEPLMLRGALQAGTKDYSDQVLLWLQSYVSQSAERTIVMDSIRYLLDHAGSTDRRQATLETLVKRIGNKNPAIDSELGTLLGQLMIEKSDKDAGKFYLLQGYSNNKYNKVAFAKYAELAPNDVGPAVYLEHLRLMMQENPLDINAAIAFAQYCERWQLYDLAAQSYQYCAHLFRYLYPSEPMPPHVYLPWAISCYNSRQNQQICLQIAESIRNAGQFDLFLEAVAGKAAAKTGNQALAQQILSQAEQKAVQILNAGPGASQPAGSVASVQLSAKQMAWFYCFARVDPGNAVHWANKSYLAEPNSPSAGALLAYALVMNNDLKWAKSYLAVSERMQISELTQAKVQAAEGDKAGAIKTLQTAIARDAGSLAAEAGKQMLQELGGQYVPVIDAGVLMNYLTQTFGQAVAPQFLSPDKILDVQFNVRGNDFSYGNELEGVVTVTNKGTEPLVISPESLFRGNFRIDAQVKGGLTKDIPELVSETVRTEFLVRSGRSLVYSTRLSTGELRRLLATHPQASLDIQFTLYLDPAKSPEGAVSNRLVDVKPATISIKRPPVEITSSYIRERFNALASAQQAQNIQTARVFTGLLKELKVMTDQGPLYPYRTAPWVSETLRSSLVNPSGLLLGQGQDSWVVKVCTMADMLSMPIDQELATIVAKNLNHPQWPVRLMTVYLLANSTGESFKTVLDWVAKQDSNELVRSLAMSFQSASVPAGNLPR
ncbi:MAG: hypothetical protein ACM3VT_14090 [Solirubrobacterales bacterium]